jgi:hypothetical protein
MARVSNANALRLSISSYWDFSHFFNQKVSEFVNDYWLSGAFRKMFESKRDRITLFTDVSFSNHYIFIYVVLALTETILWKKKRARAKKRIFFSLFKKKTWYIKKPTLFRQKPKKTHYNKLLTLLAENNKRFKAYCAILCSRVKSNFVPKLLKSVGLDKTRSMFFAIPLKIKIRSFFSILDRDYSYVWKSFYTQVCTQLWYAKKMRYFLSTLKIFFFFMFVANAQVMVDHIAYLLKKSRKHWSLLKTFNQLFSLFAIYLPSFRTFKITIAGCINDSERTRSITLGQNFVVTQTFAQPLNYALAHAATPFGALGVRIWILT